MENGGGGLVLAAPDMAQMPTSMAATPPPRPLTPTNATNHLYVGANGGAVLVESPSTHKMAALHDDEMNGLDLSTKAPSSAMSGGAGGMMIQAAAPMLCTPEKTADQGQLSPSSLRRSTRASALKAQQKIKDGDVVVPMEQEHGDEDSEEDGDAFFGDEKKEGEVNGESAPKKRKLVSGVALDQYSHEFAIKMDEQGDVYAMSDGSEASSLDAGDVEHLKKCYEKLLARELTDAQKAERLLMIKQAEADLRTEEAKLSVIKKVRMSQMSRNNLSLEAARKLAAGVGQNGAGTAYKPAVAAPTSKAAPAASLNGKGVPGMTAAQAAAIQQHLANMTPQQKEALQKLSSMTQSQLVAQLMQSSAKGGAGAGNIQQAALIASLLQSQLAATQAGLKNASAAAASTTTATPITSTPKASSSSLSAAATSSSTPTVTITSTPTITQNSSSSTSSASSINRMAAARQAFRRTADHQLVNMAIPRAPGPEPVFVPNAGAPDFLALLGLDLVVQRVLKDKNVLKPVTERPYECEECGTDFTPSWKAIGASADDLHLYCEGCVRAAQKVKMRNDRQAHLKKTFTRLAQQEKEFEKQLADGKLEAVLQAAAAQSAAGAAQAASSSTPSSSSAAVSSVQNLSTKNHSSSHGTASPAISTPLTAKANATPSSSTPSSSKAATSSSTTPMGSKRTATGQNVAQNAQMQQLQALAQMARTNPMMAAMMNLQGAAASGSAAGLNALFSNPNAAAAMGWANPQMQMMQMMQNMQRMQGGSGSGGGASGSSTQAAQQAAQQMAAMSILQAMAGAQQQQQNKQQSSRSSGSSSSSNANAQQQAQAALLAAMSANPQMQQMQMAALLQNPTIMRQMQQLAAQQAAAAKKK